MSENKILTNSDENIILEIADDGFSAHLTIKETHNLLDENEISNLLQQAGIKFGIENATNYLKQDHIKKEFNKPFLIALGEKQSPEIEISCILEKNEKINPVQLGNTSDIKELKRINKNEPLLSLKVHENPESSFDIFGNEITSDASTNQSIQNLIGKNVYFSGNKIYSEKEGYFFTDEQGKINVFEQIVLNKDIINETLLVPSNIKINGNLINSEIRVEGNIEFESAERSKIFCNGKIFIHKNARFCKLVSEQGISGRKEAFIKGGLTQSGDNIEIGSVGSSFSIPTELEITVAPFLKEKMRTLPENDCRQLETEYEKKLDDFLKSDLKNNRISITKKIFPNCFIRILNRSKRISQESNELFFENNNDKLNAHEF